MSGIAAVGLDLAKTVFQLHGADLSGRAVLRRKLRRGQVLEGPGSLPSCTVAMEACGGAHSWGREIGKLGHEVRLMPFIATIDPLDRSLHARTRREAVRTQAEKRCGG